MYATGGVDFLDRLARAEARDAEYSQRAGERRMSSNDGGFMSQSSTKVMAPPGGKTSFSFGSDEAEIKSRMQQQGRKQNARWEAQQQDGWESQQQQAMIQQQMAVRQQQQQQAQARAQQQARMAAQQQQQQQQEDYEMAMMRQQHEQQMAAFQQQQAMRQQQQAQQQQQQRPRAEPLMATAQIARPHGAGRRAPGEFQPLELRGSPSQPLGIVDYRPPSQLSPHLNRMRQNSPRAQRSPSPRQPMMRPNSPRSRASPRAQGASPYQRNGPSPRRPPMSAPGPGMASPHARGGSPRRPASPRRAASPGRGPNTPNSSTKVLAPPGGVSSISFG